MILIASILGSAVLLLLIIIVLFLLWQEGKLRRPTLPGVQLRWGLWQKGFITILLLILLAYAIFPSEVKDLFKAPLAIVAFLSAIAILSMWSKADSIAGAAKVFAFLALVIILGRVFLPAIAERIPQSWKATVLRGERNNGVEFTLPLAGLGNFSEVFIPTRGCKFSFQGPADAVSRSEADGQIRNIHAHYGRDEKWARGFRFAGPTGESVTITVTPVR